MLIHVTAKGENLWRIAQFYHVPVSGIIKANQLTDPNHLVIGQSIIIPTEDRYYTVKTGDTLWSIAERYGTTIREIMLANKITHPENIYPGLVLIIPAPRYRVKPGDTLYSIARSYGVSLASLIKVNNIQSPNDVETGALIIIPVKDRPLIYTNGYIYEFDQNTASIVRKDGEHLTYLSPFAYRIREDGSFETINDTSAVNAALAVRAVPMMAITNFTSTELGNNLAHVVLSSSSIQEKLISNMLNIMAAKGYKGVNIDFENVLPADREAYNRFLQLTVNRLHPRGYFVSTALAPKTSAAQKGSLYEAHDYEAHGRIADFVVLMTYEWGYRMGPPQPISPINQIRRVIDYAVTVIPRDKIFFGFQIYARDWVVPHVKGNEAETFSNQEAINRAVKYNAQIEYNTVAQSPFYRYTDDRGVRHEVWFEDARSAQAKFNMVKSYGLKGISYWALGYPYPQNWTLLEDNFTIKKLL